MFPSVGPLRWIDSNQSMGAYRKSGKRESRKIIYRAKEPISDHLHQTFITTMVYVQQVHIVCIVLHVAFIQWTVT